MLQMELTDKGLIFGTPHYMSPEQGSAQGEIDGRSDIYSLGVTLYEMLTHQRPFLGDRREQILAQILHKDPLLPRRINRAIPLDLETIALKCLEKSPNQTKSNPHTEMALKSSPPATAFRWVWLATAKGNCSSLITRGITTRSMS